MPQADFDRLWVALDAAVHASKAAANPFNLGLDEDTKAAKDKAWAKLADEVKATGKSFDRFPNGYLESEGGKTVVLLIWLQGSELELDPAERLMAAVQARGRGPPPAVSRPTWSLPTTAKCPTSSRSTARSSRTCRSPRCWSSSSSAC